MTQQRKQYSGSEKVALIRKHLREKIPVSDLWDQYRIRPAMLYRWQKELFDHGAAVFDNAGKPTTTAKTRKSLL